MALMIMFIIQSVSKEDKPAKELLAPCDEALWGFNAPVSEQRISYPNVFIYSGQLCWGFQLCTYRISKERRKGVTPFKKTLFSDLTAFFDN